MGFTTKLKQLKMYAKYGVLWVQKLQICTTTGAPGVLIEYGGSADSVKIGGSAFSTTELGFVDGVTAGTVTASKAAVPDANKDLGDFRNLDAVNLDAGSSGVPGSVDVFPTTAAKGKLAITKADNTANDTTTLAVAAQGQASTITIPDPGAASASVLLSAGTNSIAATAGVMTRTGQEYQLSSPAKVGGTAGWVVAAAVNLYEATLPASQTGSKLIIPIRGLKVGWTVTGFKIVLQIESAGGTVTVDADLRKLTNAAGDPTDASVGAIVQVSVTADTAVAATKTALAEVIAADEWLYIELTATTGGSTDIRYLGATVTVTEA